MEPCHDQNEGGRVINQSFNRSLGCERNINNNLNYDCLDLSSCPRCWYMNSWQHGLLVSQPHPCKQGHLSIHARGSPHPTPNLWQNETLLKARLLTPASNVPCVDVLNEDYIPEPSPSQKHRTNTPPPPPRGCPGLTLTPANYNSQGDPRRSIF